MKSQSAPRFAFILVSLVSGIHSTSAADTNQAGLAIPPPVVDFKLPPTRSDTLVRRFFEEVTSSDSDSTVFDRFTGPSPKLDWTRKLEHRGYDTIDRWNKSGASMFASIASDSFRTAALDLLPLDRWSDFWQGHLLGFIANSIGNPEEQHIGLMSSSYSAVRSSWEIANEGAGLTWGLRPWGTSPYLYFIANGGHLDGHPLITLEGRAQYTMLGSTKLEGRLTFQLPARFRLAAGTSIDPSRLGSHDPDGTPRIAVTLEHAITRNGPIPDGIFYLGFRSHARGSSLNSRIENLFVLGFSKRW